MRLDSSGNLGLGVTPSAWESSRKAFQTGLGASWQGSTGTYSFSDFGANFYFNGTNELYIGSDLATKYRQISGFHSWYTAPSGTAGNAITFTQAMTLDASGNLGVGTTSPANRLDVQTPSGTNVAINATKSGTDAVQIGVDTGPYINGGANLGLRVGGTERARIDSSGNLLVGTTSTGLQTTRSMSFLVSGGSFQTINHSTSDGSGDLYVEFGYNGTGIGSITQNGTTGVLYNITSDYRLKTVIGPVANAGQRIDALKPVEYKWKSDNSSARGFLAHEFQEVYPNSVTGTKDSVDADGNPVYQNMQASTSEVIADLVTEIQSLRIRIAQLEAE